jgi:hypothetical protein
MIHRNNTLDDELYVLNPAIEVFKTNVRNTNQADKIIRRLNVLFPNHKINFDLDDCDNILRVESVQGSIQAQEIIKVVEGFNHAIEILE